ncbi:MAG: FitA-like ribbon-helix-helix domain-containing protein [Alphaproteobacteria bacterium]
MGQYRTASLTVRGISDAEKNALRVRAAKNGRSMEAELRCIIHDAVKAEVKGREAGLATAIRARFAARGGVELSEHPPVKTRALTGLAETQPTLTLAGSS